MNKIYRIALVVIAVLVPGLFAPPSWAGPIEHRAGKLEKAGEALFQAGKYLDAIKQFQEVVRRYDKPDDVIRTARWNIARCYEELGDDEAALKAFVDFAKWAKTPDEKQDVAAKLKQVRSRLAAKVRLIVMPDGADVRIDGNVVGRKALSGAIELATGHHEIVVTKPGFRPLEKTLELKSRENKEVRLTLEEMRGGIDVKAKGAKVGLAVVRVDGLEKYRGSLPTTVQVAAGQRKVVVTVPGTTDRVERVVNVPDGGNATVVLKLRPSPSSKPQPALIEKKEPAITGQVAFSLGEGFLREGGTTKRTHVTLEALGGMRFRGARWLQVELALAISVESPVMVLLRPGLRLYTGDIPIFFRVAAQVMVTPSTSGGILLGAGGEIPLGGGWSLPLGIDVNLWPSAISVVPVEFRAGVAYAF
ncbi:MAG: PEGA domain-containing protein [Deltaproteobacteria bacterium]|nr:PEGA domain-containing protein [Deltaproteobacteria bacterium]